MKTNQQTALDAYEEKQDEIRKLLKQIEVGLEKHDRDASGQGGHHWGHVGDLTQVVSELQEIKDRLHGAGEYAKEPTTHQVFNRQGKAVKVVIP